DDGEGEAWQNGITSNNQGGDISAFLRHDYLNSDLDTEVGEREVNLGDSSLGGNDTIIVEAADGQSLTGFVVGGAGDDSIDISGNENGTDILFFGDIAYNALQQKAFDSQGFDTITGFNFEDSAGGDPAVDQMDVLNFDAFLGLDSAVTVRSADWSDGIVA